MMRALLVLLALAPACFLREGAPVYRTLDAALAAATKAERSDCQRSAVVYAEATELTPGQYGAPYRVVCE